MIIKNTIISVDDFQIYSFESNLSETKGETLYGVREKGHICMLGQPNFTSALIFLTNKASEARFWKKNAGKSFGSWNKFMTIQKKNYESVCNDIAKQLR